jgi:hypothetical protein
MTTPLCGDAADTAKWRSDPNACDQAQVICFSLAVGTKPVEVAL